MRGGGDDDLDNAEVSTCTTPITAASTSSSSSASAASAPALLPPPLTPLRTSWVFRANATVGYVHMATIAAVPWSSSGGVEKINKIHSHSRSRTRSRSPLLIAAWQASREAEGTDDQRLMASRSSDGGVTWSPPAEVPGRVAGARWSPALFASTASNVTSVRLFFAESSACWHCESKECEAHVSTLRVLGRWRQRRREQSHEQERERVQQEGQQEGQRGEGVQQQQRGRGLGGGGGKGGTQGFQHGQTVGGGGDPADGGRRRRRLLRTAVHAAGARRGATGADKPTRPQDMRPVWRPGGTIRVATIWSGGGDEAEEGEGDGEGGVGWAWERAAAAGKSWEGPVDVLAEESDRPGASIPKVIGSPPISLGGGGAEDVLLLPYWR